MLPSKDARYNSATRVITWIYRPEKGAHPPSTLELKALIQLKAAPAAASGISVASGKQRGIAPTALPGIVTLYVSGGLPSRVTMEASTVEAVGGSGPPLKLHSSSTSYRCTAEYKFR